MNESLQSINMWFSFERSILQQKIRLIDTLTEGFYSVYNKEKHSNYSQFHRKKTFFFCNDMSFNFERHISQKKILRIHTSPEGFDPVYQKQYFLTINIFAEGNHFLLLLQKEFIMYMKIECTITHYFSILRQKESSSISNYGLQIWKYISQRL